MDWSQLPSRLSTEGAAKMGDTSSRNPFFLLGSGPLSDDRGLALVRLALLCPTQRIRWRSFSSTAGTDRRLLMRITLTRLKISLAANCRQRHVVAIWQILVLLWRRSFQCPNSLTTTHLSISISNSRDRAVRDILSIWRTLEGLVGSRDRISEQSADQR